MVQFEGKYELEKSENFVEFVRSTDEVAKEIGEDKTVLMVEVEGEQYRFLTKSNVDDHLLSFTIGRPSQETIQRHGVVLNNFTEKEGNKIIIKSTANGVTYERTYEFSDHGVIQTLHCPASKVVAIQHYKRV